MYEKPSQLIRMRRRKLSQLSNGYKGMLFILPFMAALILFRLLPMVFTISLSLTSWDGLKKAVPIGLDNYQRLVQDKNFYKSIYNTFFIWALNVGPRMLIALLCSVVFAQSRIQGKQVFKAIYYFPNLVTAASIAVLASLAFDWQYGFINQLLIKIHLISDPINWLRVPILTQSTVALIIWWMWFGHAAILLTTGILGIPTEVIECAKIDGANAWKRFWKIIMPLLRPTFSYVFITSLIGGMQNFEIPKILTDGRGYPDKAILTTVMQLYNLSFQSFQYGYGATYAVGLFVIIVSLSAVAFRVINRHTKW